ncbi:hypothetical protein BH09BAC4_BH09BAC4_08770 [soil metagenome]
MKETQKTTKKHLDLGQILDSATLFQPQPCIYYLINANDEVVYVGQTMSLYPRLLNHKFSGKEFVRFSFIPCDESDLDRLEQEAIARFQPELNKAPATTPTSSHLSKQLICLKHNITPIAFERLREAFGLQPVSSFGNVKYYKPEDVDAWLKRFKGLVMTGGRHVLQARPQYLAVGISSRTKQIQLYTKR